MICLCYLGMSEALPAERVSHCHMKEILRRWKPDLVFICETHIAFEGTRRFWDREHYAAIEIVEAQGHAGGLWALHHESSPFLFQLLECTPQCVSVQVAKGNLRWVCSGVYASPIFSMRKSLWNYLQELRGRIAHQWVLLGDFNEILLPSEQRGGLFSSSRADAFAACLDACSLMDMDYFGSNFTWQKQCRGGRMVARRLDRALCDLRWRMAFPDATVEHLVRRHSDHNPILMRCSNHEDLREGKPFRFQAAWCTHADYPMVVRNAWGKNKTNIAMALTNVREDSKVFNKEKFGNIFAKKQQLEARLRGIQRAQERIDSASLMVL